MKGGYRDENSKAYYAFYDSAEIETDELAINEETVPFDFGPVYGSRKMYHFDGGAIFYVIMNAREQYRMYSESSDLIKIHFCFKGEKRTGIEADNLHFHVRQNENNLYHFTDCTGYFDFSPGQSIEYVDICLEDEFFCKITQNCIHPFQPFLDAVAHQEFRQLSKKPLKTTLRMKSVLNEVLTRHPHQSVKKASFINKLLELMLLQVGASYAAAKPLETVKVCKTPEDIKKIEDAKTLLLEQYINPPRLLSLARTVGINEYKLKRGFKEQYDNTVMGYLSDYKLDRANVMIKETAYTISEICNMLGYKSLSHFSRLFKKKFNVNPSAIRQQ